MILSTWDIEVRVVSRVGRRKGSNQGLWWIVPWWYNLSRLQHLLYELQFVHSQPWRSLNNWWVCALKCIWRVKLPCTELSNTWIVVIWLLVVSSTKCNKSVQPKVLVHVFFRGVKTLDMGNSVCIGNTPILQLNIAELHLW